MSDPAQLIAIGRIGPALGTHGEAYVEPWTDDPDTRFAVGAVLATEPAARGPLVVESSRTHSGRLVVRFAGVEDRTAVEALRNTQLLVAASDRPPIEDPDEFYDTDLIGLTARAADGSVYGPVSDVLHIGPAAYLELRIDNVTHLVPFVAQIVPHVDVANGFVTIAAPEGLFDL